MQGGYFNPLPTKIGLNLVIIMNFDWHFWNMLLFVNISILFLAQYLAPGNLELLTTILSVTSSADSRTVTMTEAVVMSFQSDFWNMLLFVVISIQVILTLAQESDFWNMRTITATNSMWAQPQICTADGLVTSLDVTVGLFPLFCWHILSMAAQGTKARGKTTWWWPWCTSWMWPKRRHGGEGSLCDLCKKKWKMDDSWIMRLYLFLPWWLNKRDEIKKKSEVWIFYQFITFSLFSFLNLSLFPVMLLII